MSSVAAAEPKRVLLLHSFGPQFVPWVFIAAQFREELHRHSPDKIDLYEISLEAARTTPPEKQGPFVDYVRSLFAERKIDLIVTMGAPAAFFVQRYRPQFFPGTPMIIGAPDQRAIDPAMLTPYDTPVPVTLDFTRSIENILDILPETKHLAWAVGASPLDRFWLGELRKTSDRFADRLTFEYFTDLSFEGMLKRVAELPPHSVIFYGDLRVDGAGIPLDRDRVLARLHEAANAPLFGYLDSYLGQGIVGGPMLSSALVGRRIAEASVRILAGERPDQIKMQPLAMGSPAYDWRELQRWNISEKRLPPDSKILFREPSRWEHYRLQIVGLAAAVLAQAALIGWLIYEHHRRQRAEIRSRNAMSELAHMNRRAVASELSASIAHEVNQPLMGISSLASAAVRWLSHEPANVQNALASLRQIVDAAHRAGDIVHSVGAMFRKSEPSRSPVDINQIIRTVLALVRLDIQNHGISLQVDLDDGVEPIPGDRVQLQQLVLNLVMNAIEAMQSAYPRVLHVRSGQTGSGVLVSIEDSGPGVEPTNLRRLFEPLFTTKARGMGIGLSICKSIIDSHDGEIWVEPGAGRGSVFRFRLPAQRSSGSMAA